MSDLNAMTEIVVDADSSLAKAVTAANVELTDLFLVLRDVDGKVFWSGDLWAWRFAFDTDKCHVRVCPVSERADRAGEVARVKAELDLRQKGLM